MKKQLAAALLFIFIFTPILPCFAVNIGTYKTETEYGLLDGFKINWKRQDKSKPFIEPREQSTQFEKAKEYKEYSESEYERTKYMYDGRAIL